MERTKKASAMSKQLVSVFLLGALIACETKTPSGPSGVTPTTSTTTTVSPTTAPTTTTTTIPVITSLARSFKAFPPPPPNQPSEMTLFFKLIAASPVVAQAVEGVTASANGENIYIVSGVYVMGNGTTGAVDGELKGVNPLENGGNFGGSITAKTPSGCQAERDFGGALNTQSFSWTGGGPGTSTCSPSPLGSFNTISMLLSDPGAPLPTVPTTTTTTSIPATTSTSTTTTIVPCTYSFTPPSAVRCQRRWRRSIGFDCDRQPTARGAHSRSRTGSRSRAPTAGHGSGDRHVQRCGKYRGGPDRKAAPGRDRDYTLNQAAAAPPDLLPTTISCSAPGPPQTVTVTVRNQGRYARGIQRRLRSTSSAARIPPTRRTCLPASWVPGRTRLSPLRFRTIAIPAVATETCSFVVSADFDSASTRTASWLNRMKSTTSPRDRATDQRRRTLRRR